MGLTELRQNGADWKRLKSDKQRKFILELLTDPDMKPTQAVVRAGYSKKTAAVMACKLMKNPIIAAILGKIQRQDVERLEIDRLETLKQLVYALTRRVSDFTDDEGIGLMPHRLPEQCQSIVDGFEQEIHVDGETGDKTIKIKYKLTPHATARDQAMKHKGLFEPERHEHKHLLVDWDRLSKPPKDADIIEQRLLEEEKG